MEKAKVNLPLIAVLIGLSLSVFFFTDTTRLSRKTEAAAPSDCRCDNSDVCYPDGCSRKPKTSSNTFDDTRYDNVCSQYDLGYPPSESVFRYLCGERQPDCCFDVYNYKESRFCCWQERYLCHPSLCEGSSGGSGCGWWWGPGYDSRTGKYLSETPEGYGCVIGDHNNLQAKYGIPPNLPNAATATPRPATPTRTPTQRPPTNTPTRPASNPTATPTTPPGVPTNTPVPGNPTATPTTRPGVPTNTPPPGVNPTSTPTTPPGMPTNTPPPGTNPTATPPNTAPTDSAGNPVFSFPTNPPPTNAAIANGVTPTDEPLFNVPEIKMPDLSIKKHLDIAKTEEQAGKTLGFFEYAFIQIKYYDSLLETTVNNWFFQIKSQFIK